MKQKEFAGPQELLRLEQELNNAWDTIEEWKTSHERVVAEAAKQNANKEAQIQDLLEVVHQRDMRLRGQDAEILEKTRQITQLAIDDRHLIKLKAHQEARSQLKARISLRDENQKQKDTISRLTDENQQQKDNSRLPRTTQRRRGVRAGDARHPDKRESAAKRQDRQFERTPKTHD